jgi:O-antigen/teichoic acid export membrane protein
MADLVAVARRFSDFPRFAMPAGFVSSAAQSLPYFLLLYYFDEATVGYFGRSFAVIAVPLTLIGSAVSRTFFVHAAVAHREGTLSETASRVHARMVMFAMFPALATLVGGPALFEVIFGEGWRTAGEYARATVVWFALVGISSPLTRIFDVTERQRAEFVVSTLAFLALAAAFLVGSRTGDPLTAILVGSVGGVAGRLLQLATTMRIASVGVRTLSAPYLRYAVYGVPGVALIFVGTMSEDPLFVLAATLAGGILYALCCLNDLRVPAT